MLAWDSAPACADYDIVVIGGGPAGAATALSLVQSGIKSVLLVEASRFEKQRVGESLIPDIRHCLSKLDMNHDFLDSSHMQSPGNASSWGQESLGYSDFLCHPLGNGWHIDRCAFDRHLVKEAAKRGVEVCTGCRYQSYTEVDSGSRSQLTLLTGSGSLEVGAKFVVDATGLSSKLARHKGAYRTITDRLTVIYGYFSIPTGSSLSKQTLLEASDYGWWYRSRLPDNKMIAAVSCDPSYFRDHQLRNWQCWLDHLASTRYVSAGLAESRFDPLSLTATPSVTGHVWPQCGANWLAVGDAARSIDPILGVGIYKSLNDGIGAGSAIAKFLHGDIDACMNWQAKSEVEYKNYLEQHQYLYALEQRWPVSAFWVQRQAATAAV